MKWTRFRIQTTTEAEDVLISNLYDLGFEGAQIEDKIPLSPLEKEQMFVDILPDAEPDDGSAVLSFFAEETERGTVVIDGEEMMEWTSYTVSVKTSDVLGESGVGRSLLCSLPTHPALLKFWLRSQALVKAFFFG